MANRFNNLRVPITSNHRESGSTPYYGANGIQDYVKGYTHDGEFLLIAEDGANDLKDYPIHYVSGKIWVNNHAHVLQAIENYMNNYFLMYALKKLNIQPYLVGGGRSKLNSDVMMRLKLYLPNREEQNKLSALLKNIDETITLLQRKINNLNKVKKGLLQKLFPAKQSINPRIRFNGFNQDWEQRELGDVAVVYDGTHQTPKYKDKGVMFLSVENIKTLKSNKFISNDDFEKGFKVYPQKDDVLMTRIGDIGTTNVVAINDKLAYYVSLALIKSKIMQPYFLSYLISSNAVQNDIWRRTLHIAFPKKINKNEIVKISISKPSLEEQLQIGELLKNIDETITLLQKELEMNKQIKKGFLQKLFPKE
ncbi:Type I restriction modification DNA specificity domain protein [Macrococcoides caseolyticum]|nr:Type I restriction modification DNA specificity domain protein [Macrococcus caseolyticus]